MRYSEDLRRRVVNYIGAGGSKAEAARRFGVCRATIYVWLKRGDDLVPGKPSPKRAHKLDWEVLRKRVEAQPDNMITHWAKAFGVSTTAIHYALRRMALSRNKNGAV